VTDDEGATATVSFVLVVDADFASTDPDLEGTIASLAAIRVQTGE
jgi:hypothetical protein